MKELKPKLLTGIYFWGKVFPLPFLSPTFRTSIPLSTWFLLNAFWCIYSVENASGGCKFCSISVKQNLKSKPNTAFLDST